MTAEHKHGKNEQLRPPSDTTRRSQVDRPLRIEVHNRGKGPTMPQTGKNR